MTKKLRLLFVVCFVSVVFVLSAGTANATSIANAVANLETSGPQTRGAGSSLSLIWTKSFSVALAGIDVPVIDVDRQITRGIRPTSALALIPGPTVFPPRAVGEAATIPSFGPRSLVMDAVSLAVPTFPNSAFAFSAAGHFGKLEYTGPGAPVGLTALDLVILELETDFIGESAAGFAVAGIFIKNLTRPGFSLDFDLVHDAVEDDGDSFLLDFSDPLIAGTGFQSGDIGIWGAFVATGVKAEPVPEPATCALFGIGLAGLAGGAARRKWKKKAEEETEAVEEIS